MAVEVTVVITARVIDPERFKQVLLERTEQGFGAGQALALHPAEQVFEVLVGSNPDVGPDQLGLELVSWGPPPDKPMTLRVVDGPTCPECGGKEVLLGGPVRPFKVDDQSNCTACRIWFGPDGVVTERNGVGVSSG